MADESGLAWENHPHVFSPGTSMESLTSIPEERATLSMGHCHSAAGSRRGSRSSLTHHNSSSLSKDAFMDARPWHTNLRRQNSAPQLEVSRSRQRLGSSESIGSRSRLSSLESVNSDGSSRASRCPACCALPHDDVDPFSSGRTSPAVGSQRRNALRRKYSGPGSDVAQNSNQRQSPRPSSVGESNSFGEVDAVVKRNGPHSHLTHSNSFGEMDSNRSHSGRRRSERSSVDESDLPGQHTARRLSDRGSANSDSSQSTPRRRSKRLSSNESDDLFGETPAITRRRNARKLSNQHDRRKSNPSGIERRNSYGHPESRGTHQHNSDSACNGHRKSSLGAADSKSRGRQKSDKEKLPVTTGRHSGYFDLNRALEELRKAGGDAEKVIFDRCVSVGCSLLSVFFPSSDVSIFFQESSSAVPQIFPCRTWVD